ncbi:MAG: CCA tRNA nucleotidyltransferase, partial [Campylobacterota bacterium]|nr:CCA tRNA nucleotidyltransferase [Campylobacterota bacterium]
YYLKLPIKDYDLEVYGIESLEDLETILTQYGSVNLVGKSFGILKFTHEKEEYDFSFPRRESKIGSGHRGFDVKIDSSMSFKEASLRRDFTINAMGYDIQNKIFLDPYCGLADIKQKTLRAVNSKTFVEDPLRVYRAVQFCARFNYKLDKYTFLLSQKMVKNGLLQTISKERIYTEFTKLLLKSPQPSIGLKLMKKLGIFSYFQELENNDFQELDAMVKFLDSDKKSNLIFMLSVLCHTMGIENTKSFLTKLTNENRLTTKIVTFVKYYQTPSKLFNAKVDDKEIRKLATKIDITDLVKVTKVYSPSAGEWLLQSAKDLKVDKKALSPLLRGKDLINLGVKPSPKFKEILDKVYALQMEGVVVDFESALEMAKSKYLP